MPETFTPITWINNGAPALNATNLNRIETGIEAIDDRAAALELGVATPVAVSYSAALALNATQGALFRVSASGDLNIADITGGADGQEITLEVLALGAPRTLSFQGVAATTISAGSWWSGRFRYNQATDTWLSTDSSGGDPGIPPGTLTAKGDLLAALSSGVVTRLAVGTANQVLTVDSTTPTGLKWADLPVDLVAITSATAAYTLVLGDAGKAVEVSTATAVNLTVPPNSSVAFPVGTVIEVTQIGAGQVTLLPGSGVTLRSSSGLKLRAQYSVASLRKKATNEWICGGDLTT